jgi:hypothetical protein
VQSPHAPLTGNGLGSNLDELVIASQYPGPSGERVLRGGGDRRPTSFRSNGSGTRLTCAYQTDAQCGIRLHNTEGSDFAFDNSEAARHCETRGWAPARAKPTRTYVHYKRMAMANSQ